MRRSSTHALRSEARVTPGFSFSVGASCCGLVVGWGLACAPSARDACESYVVHMGALPCVDRDTPTCSVDEDACQRAAYWRCLEDGTGCTDAGLLVEETAECDPACRPE